jgi:8-oxo-dGTP pyrophosphatase MutT (NUDIX family)
MNDYYANLPRKNMASGALIFDESDRLLIVKPTYKDHWSIPGGVVEKNESPLEACIREVSEEVGLLITPLKLLVVNYARDIEKEVDALMFVFDSGKLVDNFIDTIKLQENEIEAYKFIKKNEVSLYLGKKMAQILGQLFMENSENGLYFENMKKIK